MPVAKKGENKSSGVTEALKEVLPNDLKKNFTLTPKAEKGQKQKSGGEMVATYARSIEDHMLRHYEMAALTMTGGQAGTPLNIMDLIYYHTYGDYRMVYEGGKIVFKYLALNPASIGAKRHEASNDITTLVSRGDPIDGVNYVYHTTDPKYRVGEIDWMSQELNKGSSGMRLMLPSIGTLTMMTYGYANINQELQKFLSVSLDKLNSVLKDLKEDDNVLTYLVEAIKSDSRFADVDGATREAVLDDLLSKAIDKEADGDSWESAIKYFTDELIESTTSRYIAGEEVKVSDKSSAFSSDEQLELEDIVGSGNYYSEEVFTVSKVIKQDKNYLYEIEYDGAPISFQIKQSNLKPSGDQPNRFIEKKKKSFVAIPSPETIVFYSIIVDQMFALQAYLFTIKGAGKINFGYLSPTMLPQKKSQAAAKAYPNMYSPLLDSRPANDKYLKGKPNEKQSFLAQLLQHRNYYTQMVLKTQRSLATDTRIFDEFYKDDLSLKEIKWLATALSDEAKVLVAEPDKSDPLAQLIYRTPGGDPRNVQFTGEADRRTVFYKVDIPMLKEVMLEYVSVFNDFTIRAAFAIESSDAAPKEGQIARALWTSLKKRSSKLIENNEAIPHEFFNNLFEEVRKVAEQTTLSFDLYPPNWSDTNVLTLLTVDPSQLNILLTTEEYQKYLDEYIEYIYTRYGNRAKIASAITTALESYRIKNATNYEALRNDFFEMLMEHEKKRQLKATTQIFRAFSAVIAVMRGQLAVPLSYREDFIAEGYERDALRAQLVGRDYGERGIAAVPPEHPMAELLRKKAESRAAAKAPPPPAVSPSVPLPFPSAYIRASPVIPEPADIEEITESGY
jgi:hypothetical protein